MNVECVDRVCVYQFIDVQYQIGHTYVFAIAHLVLQFVVL